METIEITKKKGVAQANILRLELDGILTPERLGKLLVSIEDLYRLGIILNYGTIIRGALHLKRLIIQDNEKVILNLSVSEKPFILYDKTFIYKLTQGLPNNEKLRLLRIKYKTLKKNAY